MWYYARAWYAVHRSDQNGAGLGGAVGCEVQEQVGQVISAWMRV